MRILDTDVCVEILRGNQAVRARRGEVEDLVGTTWITAGELYYGAAKSIAPAKNHLLVTELLASLEIFGLDLLAAQHFGVLRADLEREGQRLADADLLIAAITLARSAILVTRNIRHYRRVPGLELEDWFR